MRNKMRLGDIATLITKGTTPTSVGYTFTGTGVNFVKIESIREDGTFIPDKFAHISDECNTKLKRSQLQENDILFSIAGAIGRTAIVTKDCLPANTNQALAIIRIPQGVIDYRFLLYALQSDAIIEQAEKQKQGVAQLNLSLQNINDFEIPFFTEEEQLTVVEVLSSVDSLLSTRIAQLEQLDELVKSRFIELFGDIKTGDYKFETRKLGEVAEVGSSHRVFTTEFVEEGVPFYRGTEIGELANGLKPENLYRITKEHYDRLACDETKPKLGDLLMPSICNKGQVWMVDTDEPFYYKDGRVLCISPNRKLFNCKYLEQFMREKTLVEYPKLGSGSTFAEFKIFLLKDIEVLIPPIELQDQFAAFVEQTDKSKLAVQQSITELEELKKTLMQQYFG
ncbi:MAG: restriction endonuclease subunit S [Clostridia bacterium]|nr:restriction endonuclease subunit S [Clostridia bacterium]